MGSELGGVFFRTTALGEPSVEYVCWLDVMGTTNQMLNSLPISATFIGKLQCAILEAHATLPRADGVQVRLYPTMDGCYITSPRRAPLERILRGALAPVVGTFLDEPKRYHQFLVRGAVSFGPIFHGSSISDRANRMVRLYRARIDALVLGQPVAQAYHEEGTAPPFGIAVHPSARAFAPQGDRPYRFVWYNWHRPALDAEGREELLACLDGYFEWQMAHRNMTRYHPDRISHHRQLAHEYFTAGDGAEDADAAARRPDADGPSVDAGAVASEPVPCDEAPSG